MSYLFLGESVAAAHLADLVTLLVPAGSTVPAVIFLLAAATLATPLALLLGGLLLSQAFSIFLEKYNFFLPECLPGDLHGLRDHRG